MSDPNDFHSLKTVDNSMKAVDNSMKAVDNSMKTVDDSLKAVGDYPLELCNTRNTDYKFGVRKSAVEM